MKKDILKASNVTVDVHHFREEQRKGGSFFDHLMFQSISWFLSPHMMVEKVMERDQRAEGGSDN